MIRKRYWGLRTVFNSHKGPLKSNQFEGGYATVKRKLESLGFEVEVR